MSEISGVRIRLLGNRGDMRNVGSTSPGPAGGFISIISLFQRTNFCLCWFFCTYGYFLVHLFLFVLLFTSSSFLWIYFFLISWDGHINDWFLTFFSIALATFHYFLSSPHHYLSQNYFLITPVISFLTHVSLMCTA